MFKGVLAELARDETATNELFESVLSELAKKKLPILATSERWDAAIFCAGFSRCWLPV